MKCAYFVGMLGVLSLLATSSYAQDKAADHERSMEELPALKKMTDSQRYHKLMLSSDDEIEKLDAEVKKLKAANKALLIKNQSLIANQSGRKCSQASAAVDSGKAVDAINVISETIIPQDGSTAGAAGAGPVKEAPPGWDPF